MEITDKDWIHMDCFAEAIKFLRKIKGGELKDGK